MNIIEAIDDSNLIGASIRDQESRRPGGLGGRCWRQLLAFRLMTAA
jgi:hypothetical protein